jgi:hypothetical protein
MGDRNRGMGLGREGETESGRDRDRGMGLGREGETENGGIETEEWG